MDILLSHFADKQVFPKLDLVGWYVTGQSLSESDMAVNRKVERFFILVEVAVISFQLLFLLLYAFLL